jgi:hypothetical protein
VINDFSGRGHRVSRIMIQEAIAASRTRGLLGLIVLVLGASLPNRALAQTPPAAYADTTLRSSVTRISTDRNRTVRLTSRATGRVQGNRVSLLGDSVSVSDYSEVHMIALGDIDSMWVQHGSAAPIVGLILGVPCALYGGLVGSFIGNDHDSNGSPRRGTLLLIVGMAGGGLVCGSAGAFIGSWFRRWRLEYARPTEAALTNPAATHFIPTDARLAMS